MLFLYSLIQGIYPFGKITFLRKDLYHQYLPFLYELRRRLLSGESLKYSFDLGLGSSFYGMYVYYLSDPLNFLSVLVPEKYLLEFLTFITYLKISLCSSNMCIYLRYKKKETAPVYAVLLSLCYGFSGYIASFDWNVMWMWGIALAPLAIMGMEKLFRYQDGIKSVFIYSWILFFIIWTNYYIAMIILLFSAVYFLVLCVEEYGGIIKLFTAALRFAFCSALSLCMAGMFLIPEWEIIRDTSFSGNDLPDKIKFYLMPWELMVRSLVSVKVETGLGHEPGIYASLAVLFLVPLFFLNKKIDLKHRIVRGVLVIFFYLSFDMNVLEFIWHGLNYPDSIPARQAFLLVFILVSLAYETLPGIKEMGIIRCAISMVFPLVIYGVSLALCREDSHTDGSTWILSGIFILLYVLILIIYVLKNEEYGKWGMSVFFLLLVFELLINLNLTSSRDISRKSYFRHVDNYRELVKTAENREKLNQGHFSRFDTVEENIRNLSCTVGYSDASYFSSTIDNKAEDFYKDFGMKASKVHYMAEGITPFTSAILGVGYILADNLRNNETDYDVSFYLEEAGEDYLYECMFALPFGYTVPEGHHGFLDDDSFYDPIDRQNKVAMKLGGDEIFHRVSDDDLFEDSGIAKIEIAESGHYYAYTDEDIDEITEYVDFQDEAYGEFEDMKYESIMDLGRLEEGTKVRLETDEESKTGYLETSVYRLDPGNLKELIEEMTLDPFTLTEFSDDHIEAICEVSDGRELVLALPVSKGWEVTLDGKEKIEPLSFYGLLMKLSLPSGVHHISLDYHIPGFSTGLIISLIALIINMTGTVLFLFGNRKQKASVG